MDPSGNIYLGGRIQNSVTLTNADGSFRTNYPFQTFLAKFAASGQMMWCRTNGGPAGSMDVRSLALDNGTNLYVAGTFSQAVTIGTNTFSGRDCTALYIAKYSAQGDFCWALEGAGSSFNYADQLAVLPDQSILLTARLGASAWFAGYTNASSTNLLLRLNATGSLLSAKTVPFRGDRGLAFDAAGNIYTCAWFSTGYGGKLMLAKCEPSGALVSSQEAARAKYISSSQLAVDQFGNLWLGLAAEGAPVSFGTNHFTTGDWHDAFLARYDHTGALDWVGQATGLNHDYSEAMVADAIGNIYWLGSFRSSAVSLSGSSVFNHGGAYPPSGDILFAKLHSAPPRLEITKTGSNLELRWPAVGEGFEIERSTSVQGQPWTCPNVGPTNDASGYRLAMPMTNASGFFRLRLQ